MAFASSGTEGSRLSFCASLAPRAQQPPHTVGDVHRQPDRPALIGECARDRLADPPRGIRRKLVAHPVVELLDCTDETEVALLDEVEKRHARLRVRARDRHDEPQVRFDQTPLRTLVAGVLAPGELALLVACQERAAADRAHVEPEGIFDRRLVGVVVDLLYDDRTQLEQGFLERALVQHELPQLHNSVYRRKRGYA